MLLNLFSEVANKNFSWFSKHMNLLPTGLKLALIFRKQELIPYVELPLAMPVIDQLVPQEKKFSFEKAEYFQHIFALYSSEAISKAMQEYDASSVSWHQYSPDAYFHLSVIADPHRPINPRMFLHLMPKGLSMDERQAWWDFFIRRTEPFSAASGKHRMFGMQIDLTAQKDNSV